MVLDVRLAEEVSRAYGLGTGARLAGPVAAGRLGRIWQLTTDLGCYAVKDFVVPVSAEDAERDAAYQDAVRRAGVPMPRVVRTRSGAVLADVEGPVRAYGWVDVQASDRSLDPAAVGRIVAAIHSVSPATDEAVDGWYVDPVGRDGWEDLVARLDAADAPFAGRLAALLPELLEVESILTPPREVRMCHRDLWADNLLRRPSGDLVVLDWENSGAADPAQELALVLFEFGCGDAVRMRALHEAYAAAGGTARLTGPGDLTMLVAQSHHITRTGCERWLAATTDVQRADNADWVAEFLDEPVTTRTVDLVLGAIGATG